MADAEGLAPGTSVTVAIRPEDVQVQGARGSEPNRLEARVELVTFAGSFFRVDLTSEVIAPSRLRADLAVDVVRQLELAEGGRLSVALPRGRLRVYPRNGLHG